MSDVNKILEERAKTHGDYADHALTTQSLKHVLKQGVQWDNLNPMEQEALEMIVHKIGRILSGNPHYKDHWDDIAGYATLVAKRCSP